VEIQLDRELAIAGGGERSGRRRQLEIGLGNLVIVAALGVIRGGRAGGLVPGRPKGSRITRVTMPN
jgi:hypothetical protein